MLALAASGEVKHRVVLNARRPGEGSSPSAKAMKWAWSTGTTPDPPICRTGVVRPSRTTSWSGSTVITSPDSDRSDIGTQLEYVQHHFRRRHIVFVISDEPDVSAGLDERFRRIAARHDVYWVTVRDAPLIEVPALGGEGLRRRQRQNPAAGRDLGNRVRRHTAALKAGGRRIREVRQQLRLSRAPGCRAAASCSRRSP